MSPRQVCLLIALQLATTGCTTISRTSGAAPHPDSTRAGSARVESPGHFSARDDHERPHQVIPAGFESKKQDESATSNEQNQVVSNVAEDYQNLQVETDDLPDVRGDDPPIPPDEILSDPYQISTDDTNAVDLFDVVRSVHLSYPLLQVAYLESSVADGNQLAAWGAFDTKFKSSSENGPVGFYRTYRQRIGVDQPLYNGSDIFGGYRIGRGSFQPWYLERETNDGGEFKAGVRVPLLRDREIDERRAKLWRATYEQQRVRPEIRAQLIYFVRDASIAYWSWIAAGQKLEISRRALDLSLTRNSQLEERVKEGDLDPPVLEDNRRSIALRESKLIDRDRKVRQSGIKLSLYYRADNGMPIVPEPMQLGRFPEPVPTQESELNRDVQRALADRPELIALDALSRKINVDLAEAQNNFLPSVDALFVSSQDMGKPTSSKRDKSRFELEAGLFVDVPLQRRKARGKTFAAEAKLSQVAAKRQFTQDKIRAEVQFAYAGLIAAYNRVEKAREAKRLAEYMAGVERTRFEEGQTDLLSVFIRERTAIEAADGEIDALLEYFNARAEYAAALARDWPVVVPDSP